MLRGSLCEKQKRVCALCVSAALLSVAQEEVRRLRILRLLGGDEECKIKHWD